MLFLGTKHLAINGYFVYCVFFFLLFANNSKW